MAVADENPAAWSGGMGEYLQAERQRIASQPDAIDPNAKLYGSPMATAADLASARKRGVIPQEKGD